NAVLTHLILHCPPSSLLISSFPTRRSSDLSKVWRHINFDMQVRCEQSFESHEIFYQKYFCLHSSLRSLSGRFKKVRKTFCSKVRLEEHTSELQSRFDLVCRLLLEKKKIKIN